MKKAAADFPHLNEFVRGYLHEDLVPEYGNPYKAALAYLKELPAKEHPGLAEEAKRMRTAAQQWSTRQLNEQLAKMGSKWTFVTSDEFLEILQTFERGH